MGLLGGRTHWHKALLAKAPKSGIEEIESIRQSWTGRWTNDKWISQQWSLLVLLQITSIARQPKRSSRHPVNPLVKQVLLLMLLKVNLCTPAGNILPLALERKATHNPESTPLPLIPTVLCYQLQMPIHCVNASYWPSFPNTGMIITRYLVEGLNIKGN